MRVFKILTFAWPLGLIVAVIIVGGLFVYISIDTEEVKRDVYVHFSVDDSGSRYGYVVLDADATKANGFRDPQYPRSVIQIQTKKRVIAPQRRGRRNVIATLNQSSSFQIRITDGSDGDGNGQFWDFPSIDDQLLEYSSREFPRDVAGLTGSDDDEFNDLVRRALTGIPNKGEAIAEPRRSELIQMTMDALVKSGYERVAYATQNQQNSYSQIMWSGWLRVGGVAALLVLVTWIPSTIPNASKKH